MVSSCTKTVAIVLGTLIGVSGAAAADQVTIYRDRSGVPHVYADTANALFYGAGYALAQDRLAEMELGRRAARGQLAEILGAGLIEADKEARTRLDTEAELQAQLDRWSPEHLQMLNAYVAGIHARSVDKSF